MPTRDTIAAAAFVICAFMIAYVSLVDGSDQNNTIPSIGSMGIYGLDKILHFFAYALLTILSLMVFKHPHKVMTVCLFVVAYGSFLELLQTALSQREASLSDIIANTLGVMAVYCLNLKTRKVDTSDNRS